MSPEYKKWSDIPDKFPDNLKSQIVNFLGEKRDNAIQQGFYFLRSGENKKIKKVVLCSESEDEITINQKKEALKENSDWCLVRGLKGSSKHHFEPAKSLIIDAERRNSRTKIEE